MQDVILKALKKWHEEIDIISTVSKYDCPNTLSETDKRVVKQFCNEEDGAYCRSMWACTSTNVLCWRKYVSKKSKGVNNGEHRIFT